MTSRKPAHLLLVDDDPGLLKLLGMRLVSEGYSVVTAESGQEGLKVLSREKVDLVISDLRMDEMDGLQLFAEIQKQQPGMPVIILTAHGSIPDAVAATQQGVFSFLTKPVDKDALYKAIDSALEHAAPSNDEAWRESIVTRSPIMLRLLEQARMVAQSDVSVLINGQSGTGKEILAQAIHNASPRSKNAFIAINCGALPEQLLESELFGHARGAFTGAVSSREGLFQAAEGGTLFLDEIGDMPAPLQVKLLRVLQERKVMRLGGDRVFPVNIRIFAATNKNLMELVGEHKFREDLFYRLNVLTLKIPPLRERVEDIPDLANLFLRESGGKCCLTPAAEKVLTSYGWPGNARQLRHFMEKVRIICDSSVISGEAAGYVIQNYEPPCEMEQRGNSSGFLGSNGTGNYKATKGRVNRNQEEPGQENISREITEACLAQAIEQAGGNKTEAARILGIHRSTIWRYIKKFGME